jgi:uncharacterized membrane protein YqjE
MSPDEFDTLTDNLKKLPGEFKALVEKRIELFSLEVGERISGIIAHAIYRVTGILFLALGLILILFAASKFVGDLLGNEGAGFVLVALPILLIGVLLFLRRPRAMVIAIRNRMLNQFMKDFQEQMDQYDDDNEAEPAKGESGPADSDGQESHRKNSE